MLHDKCFIVFRLFPLFFSREYPRIGDFENATCFLNNRQADEPRNAAVVVGSNDTRLVVPLSK